MFKSWLACHDVVELMANILGHNQPLRIQPFFHMFTNVNVWKDEDQLHVNKE